MIVEMMAMTLLKIRNDVTKGVFEKAAREAEATMKAAGDAEMTSDEKGNSNAEKVSEVKAAADKEMSRQTADEDAEESDESDKPVYILGIESSCDETAAAVVENGRHVLSNVIYSQIPVHTIYGGVVPEIASRAHVEKVNQVIRKALLDSGKSIDEIDAIAVTYGPGLVGPLLVGVNTAKAFAYAEKKPLIAVNHIEGHISANYIDNAELEPPFMCLVASGGHSHIVRVDDYGKYTIIGRTHDDAAGEAFDKVARAIGLGYPGGPKVDALAKEGNPKAIDFPRAKVGESSYDFSFSGLKSAVLNYLNGCEMKKIEINRADVAASFQQAVIDVLTEHTVKAAKQFGCDRLALAGGVAANSGLRDAMKQAAEKEGISFYMPELIYCTDNAAMIASAGYYEYLARERAGINLNAVPNLKVGEKKW